MVPRQSAKIPHIWFQNELNTLYNFIKLSLEDTQAKLTKSSSRWV